MSYKRLVLNRIKTPDGTILTSHHIHEYKTYIDSISNEEYMVDGGSWYTRRNQTVIPYEELSVYEDAPFEIIRESLYWGTRGQKMDRPLTWVRICDMETDHIQKCLEIKGIDEMYARFFNQELEYRKEK